MTVVGERLDGSMLPSIGVECKHEALACCYYIAPLMNFIFLNNLNTE